MQPLQPRLFVYKKNDNVVQIPPGDSIIDNNENIATNKSSSSSSDQFGSGSCTTTNNNVEETEEHPHHALVRHISLEYLNPTHESVHRKSSPLIAVFNLVATVCGGGVLSLPLAYQRAGIIPTTVLLIYAALITDFSLYILVSCARRTGGRSYGDVAKSAFGNVAEIVTTGTLVVMLCGTLIAYMILVRDIWTPVVFTICPHFETFLLQQWHFTQRESSNLVLLLILMACSPLLMKKDLHSLRHTCYVGFFSCILLMLAVVYRAYQKVQQELFPSLSSSSSSSFFLQHPTEPKENWIHGPNDEEITVLPSPSSLEHLRWYSTDPADLLFAFPIAVLCFFCSYNVLSVHASLVNPTRQRVKFVLETSLGICFFIFFMVGMGGYLYARDDTVDNILLNFPLSDPAILLGRMGFCITLIFVLPLIMVPCREAIISIPGQIQAWKEDVALVKEYQAISKAREAGVHLIINGVDFDEERPLLISDNPHKCHGIMMLPHDDDPHNPTMTTTIVQDYGGTKTTTTATTTTTTTSITDSATDSVEDKDVHHHYLQGPSKDSTFSTISTSRTVDYHDDDHLHDDDHHKNNSNCNNEQQQLYMEQEKQEKQNEEKFDGDFVLDDHEQEEECTSSFLLNVSVTVTVLAIGYTVAIIVPGVALVWSIFGSSMAIIVAFIIPTVCYLKIRERKRMNPRAITAWLILITSIIAAVVCTAQTIRSSL